MVLDLISFFNEDQVSETEHKDETICDAEKNI